MIANAKPFRMIKNIDINAAKGNLNILGTNTNLSTGAFLYQQLSLQIVNSSASIIVNSSNNMLRFSHWYITRYPGANVFSLDTIPTVLVLNPCAIVLPFLFVS